MFVDDDVGALKQTRILYGQLAGRNGSPRRTRVVDGFARSMTLECQLSVGVGVDEARPECAYFEPASTTSRIPAYTHTHTLSGPIAGRCRSPSIDDNSMRAGGSRQSRRAGRPAIEGRAHANDGSPFQLITIFLTAAAGSSVNVCVCPSTLPTWL